MDEIRKTGVVAKLLVVVGFFAGFFFLTPNFTGNAIAELSTGTSNVIGVLFLVLALFGFYRYFKKREVEEV